MKHDSFAPTITSTNVYMKHANSIPYEKTIGLLVKHDRFTLDMTQQLTKHHMNKTYS